MQTLIEKLKACRSFVVLTGAGISAESGVPTFRGAGGFWRNYSAMDLATPEAFQRDSELVWEFYNWRRKLLKTLTFNPGHQALCKLEEYYNNFLLITQNIDGLHQAAGSKQVCELHGNIWQIRCTECGEISENKNIPITTSALPKCLCGGLLRPNVVWFGEELDQKILDQSFKALINSDVFLVVGTSGVVQPAASFASIARSHGAYVVEINLEKTPISEVAHKSLFGKSGEILPVIVKQLRE